MEKIQIPRDKSLRPRSTILRNNATPQEKKLWYQFLRKHPLRFNRQRIIGEYIVDFYCAKAKLVIEIDGAQHYEDDAREYDAIRTEFLNALGLTVIRFSNYDVDKKFEAVYMEINNHPSVAPQLPPSLKKRVSSFLKGAVERSETED